MALIACHECGDKVSTSAAACPHCGAPQKQQPSVVKNDTPNAASEVRQENEHKDFRAINEPQRTSKLFIGLLASAVVFIGLAAAILRFSQSSHDSSEAVSYINREGSTLSCSRENRESCVRDAERKGFVKLSDAVAGIAVNWTAKPLRIVSVRGTAADAGVRNGDILIELDGREITEPFSILRVMSKKRPGDKLSVKVFRADRHLYFAYNVMQREKPSPSTPASDIDSPKQSLSAP
jgi:hypothetical protein